jgi:hypothetical protein
MPGLNVPREKGGLLGGMKPSVQGLDPSPVRKPGRPYDIHINQFEGIAADKGSDIHVLPLVRGPGS